ncbi:uncharacterized protein LOC130827377 [Amaranthus tricolor]|uniref:uncharacterized protein LOC130827377 n=1 Tax=Amaranthus tricolor TaxID=29722 RepID=UPI00258AA484|nr:uncharacterized protein LOC130827377 [Amaranthus tricolor]
MGSNKLEKKVKKIKKRTREPIDYDDKFTIAETNEDDVAEAGKKAHKSKKACKRKDNDSSMLPSVVVNDADNSIEGEKRKSKKAHKKKDGHSTNNKGHLKKEVQEVAYDSLGEKIKSKKAHKKITHSKNNKSKLVKGVQEATMPNVYEISLGEEDDSKGMKKWIKEFHERRPGLKVLQEKVDDFITAHEEQEEQLRKEREAKLSEEGWTVVVHRKGGKRTTDPESGVAVGSVAEASVRDKIAKKKNKDFGLDFYRFQRKEAHRSELMKLQNKFEEDKKRIQQLRAARKFKPY